MSAQGWAQSSGHQPPTPSPFSLLPLQQVVVVQHWHGPFSLTLKSAGLWVQHSAVTCGTALQEQRNQRGMNQCNVVPTLTLTSRFCWCGIPQNTVFFHTWCPHPFQPPRCWEGCRAPSCTACVHKSLSLTHPPTPTLPQINRITMLRPLWTPTPQCSSLQLWQSELLEGPQHTGQWGSDSFALTRTRSTQTQGMKQSPLLSHQSWSHHGSKRAPGMVRKGSEQSWEQCWPLWCTHTSDAVQFGQPDSKGTENNLEGTEVIQKTQLETWNRSASGKRRDCDFELQGLGRKWCLHCNSQMLWRWRENKCLQFLHHLEEQVHKQNEALFHPIPGAAVELNATWCCGGQSKIMIWWCRGGVPIKYDPKLLTERAGWVWGRLMLQFAAALHFL